MSAVAGFGLPLPGEMLACGNFVYEWEVVEELGDHFERWGWVLFCPVADSALLCGNQPIHRVAQLPQFA